ncbi:hypothetical protein Q9L58_002450 [Maublancomyces gigas]|uniref:Uncharacterized protein n=1 Tax=Discina gigas TaxID=1032678 RepID=A0ABR3GRF6_9PEZI
MDSSALDKELFGDMSDDDCPEQMIPCHDTSTKNPDFSLSLHDVATSEHSNVQIAPTPRSGHYTPPLSLPTTPDSPSENERPLGSMLLDPGIAPHLTSPTSGDPHELVAVNVSWMKTRVTDVHQLLLHYLNLREAHQSLAMDLQKEGVLRTETQEALESIREQQDQSSEDIPKLQFQIAQLKLDYQKERAARTAAEIGLANIKEKIRAHAAGYSLLQARVSDYESKEKQWQKEKATLAILVQDLLGGSGSIRPQGLPPEESPSHEILTGTGQWEGQPVSPQLVEQRYGKIIGQAGLPTATEN